ncbi:MAG: helix-turn-helix domain-containing protein [Anaerovibrio sp.]
MFIEVKDFNIRLKELITQRGMTQKTLAQKANITESALSHYLKGDRFPRAAVLSDLAQCLGTTVDYLMRGAVDDESNEIKSVTRLIARNVHQMNKEEKMKIISMLMQD